MGKITFDDKLAVEQFPEQKDWIGPMFRVINDFISQVRGTLRKGITFADNTLGMEYEFDFTFQSAAISFPQKFTWDRAQVPRALQVVAATGAGVAIIAAVAWEFTAEGLVQLRDVVTLNSAGPAVAALVAGTRYKIRVRVTP